MNKKLIVSLAVLLLIFTCVSISAATLETVDEGNFTISVPTDANFKDVGILPAGVTIHVGTNGFMSSISDAMIDGKKADNDDLLYYYIDFNDGKISNLTSLNSTDVFLSLIEQNEGVEQDSTGSYKIFKYPSDSNATDYTYEVIVQNSGLFSLFPEERIVVLHGNDLELLTEMADSVEFK